MASNFHNNIVIGSSITSLVFSGAGPGCASLVALVWTSPQVGGAIQSPMPVRWTEGYFQPHGWSPCESIPTLARMWHTGTGYTSQEAVELHFTGAAPCVEAILTTLTALGARSAQPGEFTLRAFLAGRMDLVRAEALLGLTHAESVEELADALNQHAGGISEPMARMRENLLDFLADIEASLDFADEDIAQLPLEESLLRVTGLLAQAILLGKKMQGRGHHAGAFRVALVGRPNAGKSSLFNRITGAGHGQGALVSHEAGTTRDWLSRRIDLPGSNPWNGSTPPAGTLRVMMSRGKPKSLAGRLVTVPIWFWFAFPWIV